MKNLAIIPARGGSKRIPRKNIKPFLGKPIIAYSILAAQSAGVFDVVMVSTDDVEIAECAKEYNANVPFLRSKKNSDDFATTLDVILEVLMSYKEVNIEFDNICCIYPTAPLMLPADIKSGYDLLESGDFSSVLPVTRFSYPIQRALKRNKNHVSFFWPEYADKRSQDLDEGYHDAGQWYWMKNKMPLEIFGSNTASVILPDTRVQDIDNLSDWKIAEIKHKLLENE